jgi:DNA helicase IV
VLEELLGGSGRGRMIVFFDPQQTVFGRECCVPEAPTIKLRRNFRNTRRIAEAVNDLGGLEMDSFDRCPIGEPPEVRRQESPGRTKKQLANLVARLVKDEQLQPDQIALLTPHTRKNSVLGEIDELAGFQLSGNPLERDGKLLHTTIGRFKGLESDVVIMLDVDPEDPRCDRHARYVAASRARHRLYVFEKGDWLA